METPSMPTSPEIREEEDEENDTFEEGPSPSLLFQNKIIDGGPQTSAVKILDPSTVVQGVLYNLSIRSGFASLCLHPLKRASFLEHSDDEDGSLEDANDACMVRIQFGPPPSSSRTDSQPGMPLENNTSNSPHGKNIVPFLRSHVRRLSKLGDLLQFSGGKYLPSNPDDGGADSQWNQQVDRYVMRLDSLEQAETNIEVIQPRYWNIRQVQSFQHKHVPNKQSKQSSTHSSNRKQPRRRQPNSRLAMDEPAPFASPGRPEPDKEEDCHATAAGHNTSLAKRVQSSCVANFLMNTIQHALHSSNESNDKTNTSTTILHDLQDWATCPPRNPSSVQELLNDGTGVLDIAGGSGYVAMALGLRGVRATVVDPRQNVGMLPKRDRKLFRRAQNLTSLKTTETDQISSGSRRDSLWRNLLFPALSTPKAPPPSSCGQETKATNDERSSRKDHSVNPSLVDSKTSTQHKESPTYCSPLDTTTYNRLVTASESNVAEFKVDEDILSIYYCKPVQTFNSYRVWFGGMPPQIRDVFHDEQAETLPVCNAEDAKLQNATALVALHPDEATDVIVDLAVALKKPFAVVPCCIFSRLFPHRQKPKTGENRIEGEDRFVRTRADLLDYLQAKDPSIQRAILPFEGANTILWSTFDLGK